MTYADDRALREELYKAYVTRASDQSEQTEFDNSKIMEEILSLRQKWQNYSVLITMLNILLPAKWRLMSKQFTTF